MKNSLALAGRFQTIQSMVQVYLAVALADLVVTYVKNEDLSKQKFNRLQMLNQLKEEVDYREVDLENANLTLSKFSYCSFNETSFMNATLFKTTCIGCDFILAEMTNANLTSLISIPEAPLNFSGACLVEAHFNHAKLSKAVFSHANCYEADFSKADLTGAHFHQTHLLGAKLTTAILTDTPLKQYPQFFLAILENSKTLRDLLINLLNDYLGADSIWNFGRAYFKRKHFYPVRKILSSKPSYSDEIKQLGIWISHLEKLSTEPENDSLAARVEFAKFCSGQE